MKLHITLNLLFLGLQSALIAQPPVLSYPDINNSYKEKEIKEKIIRVVLCNGIVTTYTK